MDDPDNRLAKIKQKGILEVAVYQDFPPYSYVEAGQQKGIDVEIAKALAKRLNVNVAIRMVGADENVEDDLRNNVWKGHYLGGGVADVMLHMPYDRAFSEDNDMVSFTSPYQLETLSFAIDTDKLGDDPTIAAFNDTSVGVELDTLSDFYLLRAMNGMLADNVSHFTSVGEAMTALKAGEVAAVMGPKSELEGALMDKPANIALKSLVTPGLMRGSWALGVATKAKHTRLTKAIEAAMAELIKEGTVAEIFKSYGVTNTPPAAAPAN